MSNLSEIFQVYTIGRLTISDEFYFIHESGCITLTEKERERAQSRRKKKKKEREHKVLPRLRRHLNSCSAGSGAATEELVLILTTSFEVRFIVTKRFADQTRIQASLKTHLTTSDVSPYISKRCSTRARIINAQLYDAHVNNARRDDTRLPYPFRPFDRLARRERSNLTLNQKLGGEQKRIDVRTFRCDSSLTKAGTRFPLSGPSLRSPKVRR